MKRVISLKEVMVILLSVMLITFSTVVLAQDSVLTPTVSENEYQDAQLVLDGNASTNQTDNAINNGIDNTANNIENDATNNNAATNNNVARTYNTNNNTDLPQTGIEDYNIGILLIICVASAIFAFKKIKDYKNV